MISPVALSEHRIRFHEVQLVSKSETEDRNIASERVSLSQKGKRVAMKISDSNDIDVLTGKRVQESKRAGRKRKGKEKATETSYPLPMDVDHDIAENDEISEVLDPALDPSMISMVVDTPDTPDT